MPRTYGALGPRGTNRDMLIPRPDLRPLPVHVRGGPSPTRKEIESIGDRKARERRERREGALYRETLKRAIRENRDIRLRTSDEDAARDFGRSEARRRAPMEREMMNAAIERQYAEMEQMRNRPQHEMALAMIEAEGRRGGGRERRGGLPAGMSAEQVFSLLGAMGQGDVVAPLVPKLIAGLFGVPEADILEQMGGAKGIRRAGLQDRLQRYYADMGVSTEAGYPQGELPWERMGRTLANRPGSIEGSRAVWNQAGRVGEEVGGLRGWLAKWGMRGALGSQVGQALATTPSPNEESVRKFVDMIRKLAPPNMPEDDLSELAVAFLGNPEIAGAVGTGNMGAIRALLRGG